ncbi:MAG: hypothetical protein H0X39_17690, partial [Actinobacteria bacterium]|nr:hypothetical protein [Actinomycetota bacterium]
MAASSTALQARRRASARARLWTRVGIVGLAALIVAIGLGFFYAGSPDKLASGTRIAGVDVGGLTAADAERLLERRSERLAGVPVRFIARGHTFKLTPRQLGVRVNWAAAVKSARDQGDGFGFVRGYRRLGIEFFPDDVVPPT